MLGALCCAGLIVHNLVEDAIVFAYAGGLPAFGLLLWLPARAVTGPPEEIDPAKLVE